MITDTANLVILVVQIHSRNSTLSKYSFYLQFSNHCLFLKQCQSNTRHKSRHALKPLHINSTRPLHQNSSQIRTHQIQTLTLLRQRKHQMILLSFAVHGSDLEVRTVAVAEGHVDFASGQEVDSLAKEGDLFAESFFEAFV